MPKVSVVIPNYEHENYLPQRIESILNQTFRDIEVLILDDCSTDQSRDIIQHYAKLDKRIRYFFNTTNSGSPFKQWNKGVLLCQADYVWIAESDDFAEPNLLATLFPIIHEDNDVGLAYCQSYMIDEKDKIIGSMQSWTDGLSPNKWTSNFCSSGALECVNYLSNINTIPNASAVLFRKDLYIDSGMADEAFTMCGDRLMWVKMLKDTKLCFVSEHLNYFRFHQQTTRSIYNNHQKVLNRIKEDYLIMDYIFENFEIDEKKKEELKRNIFERSVKFCPSSLKFSTDFFHFIRIVKKLDEYAYRRIMLFIFKRIFTYIPEKILKK